MRNDAAINDEGKAKLLESPLNYLAKRRFISLSSLAKGDLLVNDLPQRRTGDQEGSPKHKITK